MHELAVVEVSVVTEDNTHTNVGAHQYTIHIAHITRAHTRTNMHQRTNKGKQHNKEQSAAKCRLELHTQTHTPGRKADADRLAEQAAVGTALERAEAAFRNPES